MRRKDDEKMRIILSFIDEHFSNYNTSPTVREIAAGTHIGVTTVHRYLKSMDESNLLSYKGRRGVRTNRMNMENSSYSMPVVGTVTCGNGEIEEQSILEYIRLPESIIGNGNFFVLIAKGESMVDAGIYPGDYVVVDRDKESSCGDIVVALYEGKNNLKLLDYDAKKKEYVLKSCNSDKELYKDIHIKELKVQGVAVSVIHSLYRNKWR